MAYFSNSSEGEVLHVQCDNCRLYNDCPVFLVQTEYNYNQCKNKDIAELLNLLINKNGVCQVLKFNEKLLKITEDEKNQLELNF